MALKSLLSRALATGKQANRQDQQDGWTDGWHTHASMAESLRVLRDSTTGAAKSTAQTATTPEGWQWIARGTGKVVGGAAMVVGGVAQGMLPTSPDSSSSEGSDDAPDHLRYGPTSSDPDGSPYSSDPEY